MIDNALIDRHTHKQTLQQYDTYGNLKIMLENDFSDISKHKISKINKNNINKKMSFTSVYPAFLAVLEIFRKTTNQKHQFFSARLEFFLIRSKVKKKYFFLFIIH